MGEGVVGEGVFEVVAGDTAHCVKKFHDGCCLSTI